MAMAIVLKDNWEQDLQESNFIDSVLAELDCINADFEKFIEDFELYANGLAEDEKANEDIQKITTNVKELRKRIYRNVEIIHQIMKYLNFDVLDSLSDYE